MLRSLTGIRRMSKLSTVIKELEAFAPTVFAEKWDNVGLLIEPYRKEGAEEHTVNRILLTNDLTEPVMKEAIEKQAELIISYHPPIFKPLTKITQNHWKERVVSACLANSIALYSPHTAWDKVVGGVNDWLAKVLVMKSIKPLVQEVGALPGNGSGRLVETNVPIGQLINRLQEHIENCVHVAYAVGHTGSTVIHTVGICAGSGASLLRDVQADLIITGEMSHHELLDFQHRGTTVLLCNHSNSERGFLREFQPKLNIMLDGSCQIFVSEKDKDPLVTLTRTSAAGDAPVATQQTN
ncbi:uncharacterized protein Dwil_GK24701 [Drosophila willistoni]|uniref:NIF3-like protein 1 n=1 Tax=Drosophila willistoni TaxID=7260 RepID=B4MZQ8_DROWI|nr:NIF3-like protein 1 [Drosophila willistoni]EDW77843.2 uncharacterized protein Dwil_GK24701 [Drosophila willistoni]